MRDRDSPRAELYDLFVDTTGTVHRTEAPRCGTVFTDAAGSAQGYWFPVVGQQAYSEGSDLFVGPTPFTSSVYAISMETSDTGVRPHLYRYLPATGLVNRRADLIRDEQVYCFDTFYLYDGAAQAALDPSIDCSILFQLTSGGTRLATQTRNSPRCGSGPFSFDGTPTLFGR